jgi:hypothetical protein
MCKNEPSWIHPLADLGFDVHLIEQSMAVSGGSGHVKPDVVATSNRYLSALLFDCKGGRNVDEGQAEHYRKLTTADVLRFVDVWRPERLTHNVCYFSMESGNLSRTNKFDDFVRLVLSEKALTKEGSFSEREVEKKFSVPISVEGMTPPTLYYPFSELDDAAVIMPFVLRGLIAQLLDKKRGGNMVISEAGLDDDQLMKRIHPLWHLISPDQQRSIRGKVRDVLRTIMRDYPDFVSKLQGAEPQPEMQVTLSNLIALCEKMLAEEEKKTRLTDDFSAR